MDRPPPPADLSAGADDARRSRARVRVLVVDDERSMRDVTEALLECDSRLEVVGTASDGAAALQQARRLRPEVVVMDVNMPGVDGCEATEAILSELPDTRVVALTGQTEADSVGCMVVAGAVGYAVKGSDPQALAEIVVNAASTRRFVDPAALTGLFDSVVGFARQERLRRAEAEALALELERTWRETVLALVNAIHFRDLETEAHADRVADRVLAVGRAIGLHGQVLRDLEHAAIFHDIGKIAIPDAILHNTDALTEEEWRVVRQHTIVGEKILEPVGFLRGAARIVRHSHEHWDGSGYPDGLRGEDIPLPSRIVFACDAFDAMTSTRSYQRAMPVGDALARMRALRGVHFDPRVVEALVEAVGTEVAPASPLRAAAEVQSHAV